jgi:hypothetical protein
MKKIFQLMLLLVATATFAQTDGLSYQAVIIDPNPQEIPGADVSGNVLPNAAVAVRFTIFGVSGNQEYQEIQNTSTDAYGMINLLIGQGNPAGSNRFNEIQWDGQRKTLQVEINLDGNYKDLSLQVLTFVPYSFHRDITATGDVIVNGEVEFRGDLVVDGTTNLNNTLSVNRGKATLLTGTLTVDGQTLLNEQLDVANESPTQLTGSLTVDGFTRIKNILNVEGVTNLNNDLTVDGATELNNTLYVRGETTLNDNLTVAEESATLLTGSLQVDRQTNLNDDVNINNGAALNISGNLNVDGDTTFDNDLTVNGHTNLNNFLSVNNGSSTTLTGTLHVAKETVLQNSLQVFGQTNLESALNVNQQSPTLLSGGLTVDLETNLNSSLVVNNGSPTLLTGDLDVDGNVNLNNNLTVNGITNLNDNLFVNNGSTSTLTGPLNVDGPADLNNTLIVDGTTTLNSDLTVANTSSTQLTGTLVVDQATTLNSTLDVANGSATTLTGTLGVDGITSLNNTLNVTNASATNLSGTLTVEGVSTLNNNVTVANGSATNLSGTLNVDGVSTLNNGLTVANASATNLSGTLEVTGVTTLDNTLTVNAPTLIDSDLTVTGSTTVGSLSTRTVSIESDDPGFVATFENTNNDTGDGIVIKLGRLHGAFSDGSMSPSPSTGSDGLLELPNPIASDVQSGLDFMKDKFRNPGPLTFSDIQGLAPSLMKIGAINNLNNQIFQAFNDNLPNVALPEVKLPDIPLLTGRTIFPGASIDFLNITIPSWSFPELAIDGDTFPNLLNSVTDIIPLLPTTLGTGGLRNIDFPVIPLSDLANGNSLTKANKFIAFQDKDGRQLGAIQAESLKDYKDRTICNPVYLHGLISKFIGIDALKDLAEGAAALTTAINEYNTFGVAYASGNGDYAEWLERENNEEYLSAGDIVAVKGGKITKDLTDMEQIMVVSHRPIVLGNVPDESRTHLGNNIAFMGQVPVKIMGAVHTGDYIVADTVVIGYGKAISPKEMTPEDFTKAVGRAWEEDVNPGPKMVNTVVGVHNGDWVKIIQKIEQKQKVYEQKYKSLEVMVSKLDEKAEAILTGAND